MVKTCKLRPAGKRFDSVQICVPKRVVERKARSRGLSIEDFMRRYDGRWSFDNFHGLYFEFVDKEGTHEDNRPGSLAGSRRDTEGDLAP